MANNYANRQWLILLVAAGVLLMFLPSHRTNHVAFTKPGDGGADSAVDNAQDSQETVTAAIIPPHVPVKESKVQLGPEGLPPVIAILATHHKTGTLLFQSMFQMLCHMLELDFQQVDDVTTLDALTFERSRQYAVYPNATGRVVVVMTYFQEDCDINNINCERHDVDCQLDACNLMDGLDSATAPPIVHVVRNPADKLISGYLYHKESGQALVESGDEIWLNQTLPQALVELPEELKKKYENVPYYKMLEELEPWNGLRCEFGVFAREMARSARHYRDFAKREYAQNVHFEDFKDKYLETMETVFEHLKFTERLSLKRLLAIAKLFDITSMPKEMREDLETHVTDGKFDKKALKELIFEDETLKKTLDALARAQGYANGIAGEGTLSTNVNTPLLLKGQ